MSSVSIVIPAYNEERLLGRADPESEVEAGVAGDPRER